ncbi:probable ATP-dependent RNA helicase DDX20 [Aricia agestis]|uniref:probable ATP-dependent RNA helicase DDX20 n=1 Tax=Aricia agestis TaxID=91739 RepID=UPI001C208637|nr:probable ATP-dependent RNA helicase DDX20 [Aricia agestis]
MVLAHTVSDKIRTKDIQILQDVSFDTMLLSTKTLEGLKNSGFYKPSPVQLHGIPMGKCGFDLLLEAKSGTGKTAVFTVIALEKIDLNLGLQVLILSPTREIAAQICDVIKQIGSTYTGLCVEVVMGGLPVQDDIEKFSKNKVHILVGSPGRLKHLIQDKHIDMSAVRLFVLDEADKLMEKSFLTDIKYISSNLPQQKQVIMSSATYPDSCKEFLNQFVHGAQHICPENNSVLLGVSQKVTYVKYNSNIVRQTKFRFEELINILSNLPFKQCLIFCNYQARVTELNRMLKKAGWPVEMLHGQQDQNDRLGALKTLQEYKCRILISTDLASRGIDASNIDLVINFEPPFEWQTYLHRIGRAGRFGSYGTAITIASEGNEQKKFIALFESLNSSVILSEFWAGNNIVQGDNNHKTEEKTQCQNPCSETNNVNKSAESNEHNPPNAGKMEEYHSLLFNDSQTQKEIESFADLLLSYEEYNPTDAKVESAYTCIELPTLSFNEALLQPDSTTFNLEDQAGISNKGTLELVPELNKTLQNKSNDNFYSEVVYNNEDFIKLGLPTEFSSSKNKRICNDIKEIEINNNDKAKHTFMKKRFDTSNSCCRKYNKAREENESEHGNLQMKAHNKIGKAKKSFSVNETSDESSESVCNKIKLENNYQNKNKYKHRTENRQDKINYKVKHYENGKEKIIENDSESDSYSSSTCDSSYLKWYKQLKLRTKQIEISIYINELSSIR